MRRLFPRPTLALAAAAAAALPALAQQATLPEVVARRAQMQEQRAAAALLGGMARGDAPFDAAIAARARADLAALGAATPAKFAANVTEPASEARPEIWTNWADFVTRAEALTVAAEALDASSLDGVRAGMAAIGASCRACHEAYRI